MGRTIMRCMAAVLAALAACSPALDWREVRVDEATLRAQFPCRPERRVREVPIDGTRLRMEMVTCTAEGITFAASHFSVRDPAEVSAAIDAVTAASVANLGGSAPQTSAFQLVAATPIPSPSRSAVKGHRPYGQP